MSEPGLIRCRDRVLRVGARTLVMGVLNLTPDSFSGDGLADDLESVLGRARAMVAAGADILDVGGESTRPGHEPVSEEVELRRALPAVERLAAELPVLVSIDTRKAGVARAALATGAGILNDVSGLNFSPRMAEVAADSGAALVIGHWRERPAGVDPIEWVAEGLTESVARARAAGVPRTQIVADPGLGFAKRPPESIEILRRLPELRAMLGLPILVGASRKGFIGRVLDLPVDERLEGSLATAVLAVAGRGDMVRVHDVPEAVRAVRMADAVVRGWSEPPPSWTTVYLGLGANLGDRAASIARALGHLAESLGVRVIRRSGLYETAPAGVTDQPDFVNAVLEAETTLAPRELLGCLQRTEVTLGREPGPRWGPRAIDLDILLYGDERIATPALTIPHPELWNRDFVLVPLAELRPDLNAPDGRPISDWAAERADSEAVRPLER